MITVKNLTNSPFDIETTTGLARLPAFGSITRPDGNDKGEFTGDYLQLLKASMAVEVIEGKPSPAKDVDSVKPETRQEPEEDGKDDELDDLRKQYEELLGKKPHHKMKAETLQEAIDKALSE